MNPTVNKSDFEDLTTNLRDLAYSYLEKYNPSKQQLKVYLLKKYLTKIKEDEIEPDFVSALKLCKRRRIGPIRPDANRELFYKKDMGILARGGFSFELSKRVLDLEKSEFNKLIKII